MDMIFSKRATQIEEGIFSILNTKKEELLQAGREVYNFSVGTPDFKTPEHIMKAMEEACKDPDNYKYAMADRPEMLEAMKNFYKNRFGVELETDQIMSMYGSQEGMAHIALVMCDPGMWYWCQIQVTRCSAWDHSSWGQRWRLIHSMQKIISCRILQIFRRRQPKPRNL